jgi:hypothetical protein
MRAGEYAGGRKIGLDRVNVMETTIEIFIYLLFYFL